MPNRIAMSTLNASTIDILNVIRQNASYQYQSSVPTISTETDIPAVGEIIYGSPALSNEFINALVNRIVKVVVQSATFNNPYKMLKKGYLEFGETIEDIFVSIAQAVHYSAEKAPAREFKRTIPDVKSVFHVINWKVMYPVTIQDDELKRAFLSINGVQNLIAKIVDSVYTAAEYDEFLLFKYMLIKAISSGKFAPVSIGDGSDLKVPAKAFRGISNKLPFLSPVYNEAGVRNNTPKNRQVIFMDAEFDAQFDVEVLASAFNMDKADYMGRRFLIDDWTTFDNERFEVIRAESDGVEEVTDAELALLQGIKAVILDEEWFQVYDNLNKFTEKYVASGLYWNYFYHTWKTVSHSPFANAVVFALSSANTEIPDGISVEVTGKDESEYATVLMLTPEYTSAGLDPRNIKFVQVQGATTNGIAVQEYGAIMIPVDEVATDITLKITVGDKQYTATSTIDGGADVGDKLTFTFDGNPVPSVTLNKSTATVVANATTSLTATTVPADADVTWSSDKDSVATVSSGTVTGVSAGTANITASISANGKTYSATCKVTVTAE